MDTKRVGIVEDHIDMQLIYKRIFKKSEDIQIVFMVETAEEALEILPQSFLDIMIIDISLPGSDGFSLTNKVKELYPNMKVIISTGHDMKAYEKMAIDSGADAIIEKGYGPSILEKVRELLA